MVYGMDKTVELWGGGWFTNFVISVILGYTLFSSITHSVASVVHVGLKVREEFERKQSAELKQKIITQMMTAMMEPPAANNPNPVNVVAQDIALYDKTVADRNRRINENEPTDPIQRLLKQLEQFDKRQSDDDDDDIEKTPA